MCAGCPSAGCCHPSLILQAHGSSTPHVVMGLCCTWQHAQDAVPCRPRHCMPRAHSSTWWGHALSGDCLPAADSNRQVWCECTCAKATKRTRAGCPPACCRLLSLYPAGLGPVNRIEWRLLYNSQKHGISFSTFLGRLGEASPTLLLIRQASSAVSCMWLI